MADRKFVVKVDTTGEEESLAFDDIELDFEDVNNEPEDVHFNVNMEVTNPTAHLENDIEVRLQIRKGFDESLMILDHENIDIVIIPSEYKIVTFPKDAYDDISYRTQERFFQHLSEKGVLNRENVEGGNIYGSLQSSYVDISNPNQSTLQMILFVIWKWMEKEKPNFEFNKQLKKDYIEKMTNPDKIPGDDPENIAKRNKQSKNHRMGTYGGVNNAEYPFYGLFYY